MEEQNAFAGQGAVLLDIGGDIGALVVHMPIELAGVEIEIRPAASGDQHDQHDQHGHDHEHGHDHQHEHGHAHGALPHVAVVARPSGQGMLPTAVFPELAAGSYELYERLGGDVRLTAAVAGGLVTETTWPR